MMRLVLALLVAATLLTAADVGENPVAQLTARMAQMDRKRLGSLERYTGTLHYVLNNRRFKTHAEMTVRMAYGTGGKKEFQVLSESGSEWIRKYVFRRLIRAEQENAQGAAHHETRITPDNYNFRLVGMDTANGRPCYLLDATPRRKNKYLFRGRVWVDAEDAAVSRIEGRPAENPSLWTASVHFVHQYKKVGPYWLAASNISQTEVRIFGSTELKVEYSDYVINAGAH
jgi:outer membrane lipoprotein-sorting protein